MNEDELFEWMLENYVSWKMGSLDEDKLKKLESMDPDWFEGIQSKVISACFGKIVAAEFSEQIKNNEDVDWGRVVDVVVKHVGCDISKYGTPVTVS